jgi:hypothetical protein
MQRPRRQSPTSTARHLGALLVQAHKAAGYTQTGFAQAIPMAKRKLQMLETGESVISERDLDQLLPMLGIPEAEHQAWHELAAEARQRGWWDTYDEVALPDDSKWFIGLEQGACRTRSFEPLVVHGLLQTPAYREIIMTATSSAREPHERIQVLIEISRRRQEALFADKPLELHAVLDEAALHRVVGTPQVMHDQLTHLATLADQHENITIQVIPYEAGPHPGLHGSFAVMDFGWPDDPGLVYVEANGRRPTYMAHLADIWTYAGLFDQLTALALPPRESRHKLRDMAQRAAA